MTRRVFLASPAVALAAAPPPVRPNIVIVIWHDLGRHLSCYGWETVRSRHLDRMASEGVLFTNAFCTSPGCSPSRSSMMTGLYPHEHGVLGLTHRGWNYFPGTRCLPHYLNAAGYETYLFGLQHEVAPPSKAAEVSGYQHAWQESYHSHDVAVRFEKFLANERPANKPFFAHVGTEDVHRPNIARINRGAESLVRVPSYVPDTPAARLDIAMFEEMFRHADEMIGRILGALQKHGLDRNTLVLFTTDHGPEWPRAKVSMYDPGLQISLIAWGAGVSRGARCGALVSNLDILPTCVELAKAPGKTPGHGRPLTTALYGQRHEGHEWLIGEKNYHVEYEPIRTVRNHRWKYIRNYKPGTGVQQSLEFAYKVGVPVVEKRYGIPRPAEELYDILADPGETVNLAGDAAYGDVLADVRRRLQTFQQTTNDPLLKGDIPATRENPVRSWWEPAGNGRLRWRINEEEEQKRRQIERGEGPWELLKDPYRN